MEIKAFSVIDLKTSKAIVRLGQFKKEDPKNAYGFLRLSYYYMEYLCSLIFS